MFVVLFAFAFAFNAVDLDLPETSIPFSKLCQRLAEAPWMARRALPHRMCDQRVPVDDMILKIAAGNPKGRLSAKKTFEYFSSFEKYFVVPWNGIEKRHGWQA